MIFSFIFFSLRNPFQHPVCLLLFVVAVSCATRQEPPPPRGFEKKTLEQMKPPKSQYVWARGVIMHMCTYAYEKYVTQDGARAHNEIPSAHKICKKGAKPRMKRKALRKRKGNEKGWIEYLIHFYRISLGKQYHMILQWLWYIEFKGKSYFWALRYLFFLLLVTCTAPNMNKE